MRVKTRKERCIRGAPPAEGEEILRGRRDERRGPDKSERFRAAYIPTRTGTCKAKSSRR